MLSRDEMARTVRAVILAGGETQNPLVSRGLWRGRRGGRLSAQMALHTKHRCC